MKIHEYQAKALLAAYGIAVPPGKAAETPAEVRRIASDLGGKVVIKAQVYAGGRGKAGGIKSAADRDEAAAVASALLDTHLVTHQTTARGAPVRKVLVEKAVDFERELYLSIIIDSAARMPVMIASAAGGMDIEEVSKKHPEKVLKVHIDPATGFRPFQARKLAYGMDLKGDQVKQAVGLMSSLYKLFKEKDCSLAEINPLVVTKDGNLLALDAKLNFDDSALFRHDDIRVMHDPEQDDPFEAIASELGIKNYVKLNGNIGCAVNGAGLAMAVLDLVKYAGGSPANFLDIGTVNNTHAIVSAFKVFTSDPDVKSILINIFGGMSRADIIAQGIIEAFGQMEVKAPVIVRLAGTNFQEGKRLLAESGIKYIEASDFHDAAVRAVAAAKQAA
jgi:succinyl-CoA synthetase beta subunit